MDLTTSNQPNPSAWQVGLSWGSPHLASLHCHSAEDTLYTGQTNKSFGRYQTPLLSPAFTLSCCRNHNIQDYLPIFQAQQKFLLKQWFRQQHFEAAPLVWDVKGHSNVGLWQHLSNRQRSCQFWFPSLAIELAAVSFSPPLQMSIPLVVEPLLWNTILEILQVSDERPPWLARRHPRQGNAIFAKKWLTTWATFWADREPFQFHVGWHPSIIPLHEWMFWPRILYFGRNILCCRRLFMVAYHCCGWINGNALFHLFSSSCKWLLHWHVIMALL